MLELPSMLGLDLTSFRGTDNQFRTTQIPVAGQTSALIHKWFLGRGVHAFILEEGRLRYTGGAAAEHVGLETDVSTQRLMRLSEALGKFNEWRAFNVSKGTVASYHRDLRIFCLWMRDCDVEDVTLEHVLEYLKVRQDLKWDRNSFIPTCMALKKFFQYWRQRGILVIDPDLIPTPRKEYKLPRVANENDNRKLMAVIPADSNDGRHIRNRAIVMMLWDTGARNGELMSLDVGDVDLSRMRAVIRTEKNRGRRPFREIFWNGNTNHALKRWIEKREQLAKRIAYEEPDALFVSIMSGGRWEKSGKRFTVKGVGEMLRRYSDKAGIPPQNAHARRHQRARAILWSEDGNLADVMNILGHASLASSSIYVHENGTRLEERYRKIVKEFKE